jgi:hypothetical protein
MMQPGQSQAIGKIAYLPFGAPCPRRSRRYAFAPPIGAHLVEVARGGSYGFAEVRLRCDYLRYIDGPRWAGKILPEGSTQILPLAEAEALVAAGFATRLACEDRSKRGGFRPGQARPPLPFNLIV